MTAPTTTPAQPAQGYEHARAIMEGERNASLEQRQIGLGRYYIIEERRAYEAGFTNGWDRHAAQVAALTAAPGVQADVLAYAVQANIDGKWCTQWPIASSQAEAERDMLMYTKEDQKRMRVVPLAALTAPAQPAEGAAYAELHDERDEFEKVFPLPSGCIRVGTGYASTGYSNWAAHTHCERWKGWKARASSAQAPAVADLAFMLKTARLLAELHGETVLSEQQCAKHMGIDLVSWRKLEDCLSGGVFMLEGGGAELPREDSESVLREALGLAPSPTAQPAPAGSFQQRVQPWLLECFGAQIAADRVERNHRFLEEALELVQSLGCTASEAHQLVDYVFGRPVGDPPQEVGGVMVTLAALCLANSLDMHDAGEVELARINAPELVAKIRAKQAAKPKHSPLPEAAPAAGAVAGPTLEALHHAWMKIGADVAGLDWGAFTNAVHYAPATRAAPQPVAAVPRGEYADQLNRFLTDAGAAPTSDGWPRLERTAALHEDGTARFGKGVSARLLVEAAYRNAERTEALSARTPEQRKDDERKRREAWDLIHGSPFFRPGAGPLPTHRCKVCGALWRYWPKRDTGHDDSWNLRSSTCGKCCDMAPMGDQIEPLTWEHLPAAPTPAAQQGDAPPRWMPPKYNAQQRDWCVAYEAETGFDPMMDDYEAGLQTFAEAAVSSLRWYEDHTTDAHLRISSKVIPGVAYDAALAQKEGGV